MKPATKIHINKMKELGGACGNLSCGPCPFRVDFGCSVVREAELIGRGDLDTYSLEMIDRFEVQDFIEEELLGHE